MSTAAALDPAVVDPVALAQELIRCPSVTPADEGALGVLERHLGALGFACHRLRFSEPGTPDVENLYARIGEGGPNVCFAGHTDVVPIGDRNDWTYDPFGGVIADGVLYGRGAADMKGAIAAFVAAAARHLAEKAKRAGSISLLITGDEEGPAINGTKKVLRWLAGRGERLDACIVGEPTNPARFGEMAKIGRRGSLNAKLTVRGVQGHVAYPQDADNPNHRLLRMLNALVAAPLDQGNAHFQPSSLQVTTIDVGNPTTNLIPARATAGFNIRFNDIHTGESLTRRLRTLLDADGSDYDLAVSVSGESFLTPPGRLSDLLTGAVRQVTGLTPELSTSGGTSDARFIKDACPVLEYGLISATAHKVDENARVADIAALTEVYRRVLDGYRNAA